MEIHILTSCRSGRDYLRCPSSASSSLSSCSLFCFLIFPLFLVSLLTKIRLSIRSDMIHYSLAGSIFAFACLFTHSKALSSECSSALTTAISVEPESICFAKPALQVFLPTLLGSTNASIAAPLATYLEAVCPAPLCTDAQIEKTFATIGAGCSDLFDQFGIDPSVLGTLVPAFPTIKSLVCLEATPNATSPEFCIVDVTKSVETLFGQTVTKETALALISGDLHLGDILPKRSPAELRQLAPQVCTDCFRAYVRAVTGVLVTTNFLDNSLNTTVGTLFVQTSVLIYRLCGPDFFNVATPINVYNGTNITYVI